MILRGDSQFFVGVIEDRNDPLMLGRSKVRVAGLHTHNKEVLPTKDLPWAVLMQPASGGTASAAIAPAEGTTVIVVYADYPENQQPIIIGVIGGIPQEDVVFVDKLQPDTPLWKDGTTPAGRKIPTNQAEAGRTVMGPLPKDAEFPVLKQMINQGSQQASDPLSIITNALDEDPLSYGGVGEFADSIGGVGSSYGIASSEFQDILLGAGGSDTAAKTFIEQALSGIGDSTGQVILQELGKDVVSNLARNLGLTLPTGWDSVFGISPPAIITPPYISSIPTKDTIKNLFTSVPGVTDSILNSINIPQLSLNALGGILNSGITLDTLVSGAGGAASLLNINNIASPSKAFDNLLKSVYQSTSNVAAAVNGSYSSMTAVSVGVGNIAVTTQKQSNQLSAEDFKDVPEGSTPPIKGSYGGPNFGGASPVITKPVQDMRNYEGGSTRDLTITAPPGITNWSSVRDNVSKILAACTKYGFSTKEQQASLLAIIGGECGWIPQDESCQYSNPSRLCEIFKSTFKNDIDLATSYSNWLKGSKGSPADFFNFVYDPANNGRQLGNTQPGDGGKYYGRGFIQLTGRANYQRYGLLVGQDLIANPDMLNDTIIAAEVAVLYLMDRVKGAVPTSHPGYFYAAKKAVGNNSPDIAARKLSYYEHFYGLDTPESYGYTEKLAGPSNPPNSYNGSMNNATDSANPSHGFQDPNRKYPLKRQLGEPDINRLARGVTKETIVPLKQSQRTTGIPIAMGGGYWDQPSVPFGGRYPYNHVRESESGHIQEFDDTPGYERVHTYHRKGTFQEIDANGTMVTKVVGDGYVLYDRNGFISIEGEANVTVSGNVNIYCRSDANIEVAGSAEMKVGGSFDIGVARDMNIAVEGNFSLWANGVMNLQTASKGHILAKDNLYIASNRNIHTKSVESTYVHSLKKLYTKSNEETYQLSLLDFHTKSKKKMYVYSENDLHIKTPDHMFQTATKAFNIKTEDLLNLQATSNININTDKHCRTSALGTINLKASGNVDIDGAIANINSGTAVDAGTASSATAATDSVDSVKALINGMVPPALGIPTYPRLDGLPVIELHGDQQFLYELPSDGESKASTNYNKERVAQEGKANTYESETQAPSGGSTDAVVSVETLKKDATEYNGNFKLSDHFTLGMLNPNNYPLIDQCGLTKQQIVANLSALCTNILEKYLPYLPDGIQGFNKSWRITSGYRPLDTPNASSTSDHPKGRACDIQLTGRDKEKHFELIKQLDKVVSYDQLLLEYAGASSVWIHTGYKGKQASDTYGGGANRSVAFTMKDHKKYGDGFTLLA